MDRQEILSKLEEHSLKRQFMPRDYKVYFDDILGSIRTRVEKGNRGDISGLTFRWGISVD